MVTAGDPIDLSLNLLKLFTAKVVPTSIGVNTDASHIFFLENLTKHIDLNTFFVQNSYWGNYFRINGEVYLCKLIYWCKLPTRN